MNYISRFVSNTYHAIADFRSSRNQSIVKDNSLSYGAIPKDVFIYGIFSRLIFEEWLILSQVNKRMNNLLSDPVLLKEKIYCEKTFNPEDWGSYFGNFCLGASDGNIAYQSLPDGIGKLFKGPSPVSKRKKLGQTHVIVWIPSGISIDKYKDILTCNFPLNNMKPGSIGRSVVNQYRGITTKKAEWVVMPRNRKFGSPYCYKIVDYKTLAIPKTLEVIICMTTTFFKSGMKSSKFKYYPLISEERVKVVSGNDIVRTYPIIVRFTSSGVSINMYDPRERGIG